jgi:hypothetical protein
MKTHQSRYLIVHLLELHHHLPDRGTRNLHQPSSRSLLVGEQSNAWRILLRNDRKSRHRRIKNRRRYGRLAATSQLSLW